MADGTTSEVARPAVSKLALAVGVPLGILAVGFFLFAKGARIDTPEEFDMALGNSWPTAAPLAIATVFLVFGVSWRLRPSIQFLTAMALALGVWLVSAYSLRFSYQNHYDEVAQVATRTEIEAFKISLQTFEKDCGRLPSSEEGLGALVQKPANVPGSQWHGPYLDSIPKDPWGHGYIYHCPGRHGTNQFEVYSSGPDGVSKSGGADADDIASWNARSAQ